MAKKAEDMGVVKTNRDPLSAFALAVTAGIFIGIAFVFYIVVTTGGAALPYGIAKLIGGLAFSLGLVLVVICGGELFTSSVLTVVARASGKVSNKALFKNWLIVYLGNFAGAMMLVFLMWLTKHYTQADFMVGANYLYVANNKLHHSFVQAVALGIMCNLLVCLAIWMTFSGRTVVDKVVVIILPIAMFVAAGFEHCIANMFLIPMAILIKQNAPDSFWQQTGLDMQYYSDLTWSMFLTNNLLPVTIGNIIGGGLLVALTYWIIYLRPRHHQ
ncbi:formate transporter FocA [Thalassotalea ponticola]|nr:formate transporter FocA [Thalassotalea ponticola]MDN3653344.1 formate transporter FocA [Thalassotalea ponticola]